jgi:hypothetical protein
MSASWQIFESVGPSGTNIEYALKVAHYARQFHPHVSDEHVAEVRRHVLQLCSERKHRDECFEELGIDLES